MRTIAITGAGGLIGTALVRRLVKEGDRVILLSRSSTRPNAQTLRGRKEGVRTLLWSPEQGLFPGGELEGIDAFVHLAGEPLLALRWTTRKKERILRSREVGTQLVARGLARMDRPPKVVVSASAVGFYGDRGNEVLTETSDGGEGFLAQVCHQWEGAMAPARDHGIRTVLLRTGFVLSRKGGALAALLPAFRLGVGGRLGDGEHFLSWIDIADEVGLILHAIKTPEVEGPLNATAPRPVTNADFTQILGEVLRRPTLLPLPASLIRLGLGEMGTELLLSGQNALPAKALSTRYTFRFEEVGASLRHQLRRPDSVGGDRSNSEHSREGT